MADFCVKPLDVSTWPQFAQMVEKHNGVWGGCWCMAFHPEGVGRSKTVEQNRAEKERRVQQGHAHAALVYDDANCVGWCQFGPTEELPRIKRLRVYREGLVALPDWRITCFFVDKSYRGKGVASAALAGALQEIACLGGDGSKAIPKMWKAGRFRRLFCTTDQYRCLNDMDSSVFAVLARTIGWSPKSSNHTPTLRHGESSLIGRRAHSLVESL
ncbi:GNAT family N-acetyltransferase [Collimonas sp. NPDC087041]|uniref:GNAT family N-acetyltransferase n=1 Tax=Collimonas sp. NPDC087041 TaxID=3363960 RepID=UPI003814D441